MLTLACYGAKDAGPARTTGSGDINHEASIGVAPLGRQSMESVATSTACRCGLQQPRVPRHYGAGMFSRIPHARHSSASSSGTASEWPVFASMRRRRRAVSGEHGAGLRHCRPSPLLARHAMKVSKRTWIFFAAQVSNWPRIPGRRLWQRGCHDALARGAASRLNR